MSGVHFNKKQSLRAHDGLHYTKRVNATPAEASICHWPPVSTMYLSPNNTWTLNVALSASTLRPRGVKGDSVMEHRVKQTRDSRIRWFYAEGFNLNISCEVSFCR